MMINRNTLYIVLSLILTGMMISCDNELNLTNNSEPYPIVYGILATDQDTQFIRVEKSFVDNKISPNELAQDPDNLYFDNIQVRLTNGRNNNSVFLNRIDGNTIGLQREEGMFADSPNYLYFVRKDEFNFRSGDNITVDVIQNEDSIIASSSTKIIPRAQLTKPNSNFNDIISLVPNETSSVIFSNSNSSIDFYDISFDIVISEFLNNQRTKRVIKWNALTRAEGEILEIPSRGMYTTLGDSLEEIDGITRTLDSLYMTVFSYGEEIGSYINVRRVNTGITASNEVPVFTNIEGGFGIFSSRSRKFDGPFVPTELTVDSLQVEPSTRELGFVR